MPSAYLLVKVAHVLLAVLAGGASAASGVWLELPRRTAAEEAYVLRAVRLVQLAMVLPALLLLPVAGMALVSLGGWSTSTPWLDAGAVAWAVLLAGIGLDARLLRRQSTILAAEGLESRAYRRTALAGRLLGGALGLLFVAILYVMVVKP